MCGSLSSCLEITPDPRPPEKRTTRTVSRDACMKALIRNGSCGGGDGGRAAAPLLTAGAHQEFHIGNNLLHGGNVHLARAQAGRALRIANPVAMLLTGDAEIQLFRIVGQHVADDLAVLAEEQP